MSDSVSWSLQLKILDGRLEHARALIREMIASTEKEAGTVWYEWYLDAKREVCHTWEDYADAEATLTHLANFQRHFGDRFSACFHSESFFVYGEPGARVRKAIEDFGPVYLVPLGGFSR